MKGQKEEPYENLTTGVLYAVNLHTVIQEGFFFLEIILLGGMLKQEHCLPEQTIVNVLSLQYSFRSPCAHC